MVYLKYFEENFGNPIFLVTARELLRLLCAPGAPCCSPKADVPEPGKIKQRSLHFRFKWIVDLWKEKLEFAVEEEKIPSYGGEKKFSKYFKVRKKWSIAN